MPPRPKPQRKAHLFPKARQTAAMGEQMSGHFPDHPTAGKRGGGGDSREVAPRISNENKRRKVAPRRSGEKQRREAAPRDSAEKQKQCHTRMPTEEQFSKPCKNSFMLLQREKHFCEILKNNCYPFGSSADPLFLSFEASDIHWYRKSLNKKLVRIDYEMFDNFSATTISSAITS